MNHYQTSLMDVLRCCPPERYAWLEHAVARIRASDDPTGELSGFSAMARRKMGDCMLPENLACLETPAGPLHLDHWSTSELARTVLILAAMEVTPDAGEGAIDFLFRQGDETERATIARGLALFDDRARLKHLIIEAGRANSLQLVSAVSQCNPYPKVHYTEHEFNQLVLKNLFIGQPIARIMGLEERANPELSRMCEDYYDERTAAGREVPCDIWLAMGPYASKRAENLMSEHLSHDKPEHRCYAGMAIGRRLKLRPELRKTLEERLNIETNARVLQALQTALAG
jgi:hypothetical protein